MEQITRQRMFAKFVESTRPEHWPTLDELPEVDTSDIEEIGRATEVEEQY
jgi:hypothetical protein